MYLNEVISVELLGTPKRLLSPALTQVSLIFSLGYVFVNGLIKL